jgi:hypothetical protein
MKEDGVEDEKESMDRCCSDDDKIVKENSRNVR